MNFDQFSDEDLMKQFCATLDEEVFRVLAERYYPAALRRATRFCGDRELACDAVQDVMIRIVRCRRRYSANRAFAPWFFAILRNRCIDLVRKRNRQKALLESYNDDALVQGPDKAALQYVHGLLSKLPADQAYLLRKRYIYGLSMQELAEHLGCSIEAAKKRIQRTVRAVREKHGFAGSSILDV